MTTIYELLEEVTLPGKEPITAVDLVKSNNRGKAFGRLCMQFAGLVRNSEERSKSAAQIEFLSKLGEDQINALINRAAAEPESKDAPNTDNLADGLLARGVALDADFPLKLVEKFEALRTEDKAIVTYLNEQLSDLAWDQMGWEDKQNIAANYAVFFMRK